LLVGTFARSILSYPLDSLGIEQVVQDTTIVQVTELEQKSFLSIHPNPSSGFINLTFSNINPGKAYEIAVLNASGQLIKMEKGQYQGEVVHQIDIGDLVSGWYIAKVKLHHQIHQAKFLKH